MQMNGGEQPLLSVVIPTMGRDTLVRTLESLVSARGADRMEILVIGRIPDPRVSVPVDGLLLKHASVRHLPLSFPDGDSSRKKNAGCEQAASDVVAFVDDDVVVAPDWPERIAAPFRDPKVGLVSGPSLVPNDVPLMARLAGHTLASMAAGYVAGRYKAENRPPYEATWSALIGCNMAFRKSVLRELGGFKPEFWPGEEMIASHEATRRGYKLVFQPAACLYHYPRSSLARFCKQIYGYGATRIRLIRAGVQIEWTTLLPAAAMAVLPFVMLAAVFSRIAGQLLAVTALFYVIASVAVTLLKVLQTRRAVDALILFLIPVMHVAYGIAEWAEILNPNRDLSEGALK